MSTDWFANGRLAMQSHTQKNLLKYAITDTSTVDDMLELDEILETFNNGHTYDGDTIPIAEAMRAISAETVTKCDKLFIQELQDNANKTIDVPFDYGDDSSELIAHIMNSVEELTHATSVVHLVANPLLISILRSLPISRVDFKPANIGRFKGPNNTADVGTINGVTIYSYIFNRRIDLPNDVDMVGRLVVIGYDEKNETFSTIALNVAKRG